MRKNLILIIAIVMFAMLTGCTSADTEVVLEDVSGESASEASEAGDVEAIADSSFTEASSDPVVVVYVCGAVAESGVYELPSGARLDDAVKAAGGFGEEADRTYVNLAAPVTDGMKLYIPTTQEVAQANGSGNQVPGVGEGALDSYDIAADLSGGQASDSGLVNINTATKEELTALSGIGAGCADRIIAYRNEKGPFKSIEDIMKVSGIKEKLFSKIKDQITV